MTKFETTNVTDQAFHMKMKEMHSNMFKHGNIANTFFFV